MFFSYLNALGDDDRRLYEIVSYLTDYFGPSPGDSYYIIDPYLDVLNSILYPFKNSKIEEDTWSFLFWTLSNPQVEFKVITREDISGIERMTQNPPFQVPVSKEINGGIINVCKYIDKKYTGLSIHDRYILQENGQDVKGMHLGCSLSKIFDKDICITTFSDRGTELALHNFKRIWAECIIQKGWKKG
jgi:hypothetical protein